MVRRTLSSQQRVLTLFLATALAITGALANTGGVAAAAPTTKVVVPVPSAQLPENGLYLTSAQIAQANQTLGFLSQKGVLSEFSLVNGALTLQDSLPVVQAKYNLSAAEVQTIQSILTYAKQRQATTLASRAGVVSPNISVNGTVIYFTFSDVGSLLIRAAAMGPVALLAALNGIAWMFGGPIGGTIGLVLSIVGMATIADMAVLIVQGYARHQGIYFGITWNWIFPSYVQGNWCGCS
jgi:hypothetical protein